MAAAGALSIARLSAGYGPRKVLRDLSLDALRPGTVTALVGPNAAGKSTLLRAMAGLVKADGAVHYGETDLMRLSIAERSRLVGFMPQSLPTGASLTVLESVLTALMAFRHGAQGGASAREQAFAVLERLAIADLAMSPLDSLSGGQRQMVGLAQAIARRPKILLLDEPTSALDLARQHQVMAMVRAVAQEGRIVVAVLHDLALAAQWADHVVMLDHGTVHVAGRPEEAITPAALRAIYGIDARVERCSQGRLQIMTDGLAAPA